MREESFDVVKEQVTQIRNLRNLCQEKEFELIEARNTIMLLQDDVDAKLNMQELNFEEMDHLRTMLNQARIKIREAEHSKLVASEEVSILGKSRKNLEKVKLESVSRLKHEMESLKVTNSTCEETIERLHSELARQDSENERKLRLSIVQCKSMRQELEDLKLMEQEHVGVIGASAEEITHLRDANKKLSHCNRDVKAKYHALSIAQADIDSKLDLEKKRYQAQNRLIDELQQRNRKLEEYHRQHQREVVLYQESKSTAQNKIQKQLTEKNRTEELMKDRISNLELALVKSNQEVVNWRRSLQFLHHEIAAICAKENVTQMDFEFPDDFLPIMGSLNSLSRVHKQISSKLIKSKADLSSSEKSKYQALAEIQRNKENMSRLCAENSSLHDMLKSRATPHEIWYTSTVFLAQVLMTLKATIVNLLQEKEALLRYCCRCFQLERKCQQNFRWCRGYLRSILHAVTMNHKHVEDVVVTSNRYSLRSVCFAIVASNRLRRMKTFSQSKYRIGFNNCGVVLDPVPVIQEPTPDVALRIQSVLTNADFSSADRLEFLLQSIVVAPIHKYSTPLKSFLSFDNHIDGFSTCVVDFKDKLLQLLKTDSNDGDGILYQLNEERKAAELELENALRSLSCLSSPSDIN